MSSQALAQMLLIGMGLGVLVGIWIVLYVRWEDRREIEQHEAECRRIEAMNVDRRRAGLMPIPLPGKLARR
jgi:hypothetical protein